MKHKPLFKVITPHETRIGFKVSWICWDKGGRESNNWRKIKRERSLVLESNRGFSLFTLSPTVEVLKKEKNKLIFKTQEGIIQLCRKET